MIVVLSGYYSILTVGHVEYIEKAAELLDQESYRFNNKLLVIINNDEQLKMKVGHVVMPLESRMKIIQGLKYVDQVIPAIDSDKSVCNTLRLIRTLHPKERIIFAKGGDRFASEIPEMETCRELNIEIVDGLGDKIDSSSNYYRKTK